MRGAVPRHVFLHSRALTWRLRGRAGASQGPGLLMYLCGGRGKRTRTDLVVKASRLPKTKNNCCEFLLWKGDEDRLSVALCLQTVTRVQAQWQSMGTWLHKNQAWLRLWLGFSRLWLLWWPCWRPYTRTPNHLTQSRAPLLNPGSNAVLWTQACVHPYYSQGKWLLPVSQTIIKQFFLTNSQSRVPIAIKWRALHIKSENECNWIILL